MLADAAPNSFGYYFSISTCILACVASLIASIALLSMQLQADGSNISLPLLGLKAPTCVAGLMVQYSQKLLW